MSLRTVSGLLIALAVLFAPSAVAAQHMADPPRHRMQMMEMGHCDGSRSNSDHDKAPAKSCCMSMCMAVAVSPEAPLLDGGPQHAATYFPVATAWHGFLGEIATPPPRSA